LIVAAGLLFPHEALSHNAPAGWAYDSDCCSGVDCYEIDDSEIEITAQGYEIKATREVVPFVGSGGKALDGGIITRRRSKDEHYHRCSRQYGSRSAASICLYVPPFGM
jgi:hypothetical protein